MNDLNDYNQDDSLKSKIDRLLKKNSAICALVDRLIDLLEEVGNELDQVGSNHAKLILPDGPGFQGINPQLLAHLRRIERKGVQQVTFHTGIKGFTITRIDRYNPFMLPDRLTLVLKILYNRALQARHPDQTWVSRKELQACLTRSGGKSLRLQSVNHLVYRLRRAFWFAGGLPSRLIETHRSRGVRLRIDGGNNGRAHPLPVA